MSLYNNFGEESLREGARYRPSTPELSHSHSHSHEDVQIRWSNLNHTLTLTLTLKVSWSYLFFALPRFACAIVTFATPRYACLLLTRAASRYVPSLLFRVASICMCWIVVFPSHDLLFYFSLARLPKSGQKPPKSTKSSFSSKSVRVLFTIF